MPKSKVRFPSVIKSWLLLNVILLSATVGQCQPGRYILRHYNSNNGLPQNSILHILFDKNGYCWLTSEAGLIRFDNKEFKTYATDNIPGLIDNRFHGLTMTINGDVYASNVNQQVVSTVPINDLFAPAPVLMKHESPYYFPAAGYAITNNIIGELWDSIKNASSLPLIRTHYALKNGDTYLVHASYIFQINEKKSYLLKKWDSLPLTSAPVGNYLLQLWNGNKIALWQHGVLLPPDKIYGDILKDPSYLQNISQLFWSPNGTFLFSKGAIFKILISGNKVLTEKVISGLPIQSIACIYFTPKNNTYYIGTSTDGLFIVKLSPFSYPVIPEAAGTNSFYAIGKTSRDALIVKNTFIPKNKPPFYLPLGSDQFRAYVDKQDRFYYQSGFKLFAYNTNNHQNRTIMDLDESLASILVGNNPNELLVCTRKSLTCLSETRTILWKRDLPIEYNKISVNKMFHLDNNLYILLTTKGAKWYDLASNKILSSILNTVTVRSFYRDHAGRLWFGTDGAGIYMYQNAHLYAIPLKHLNRLNTVHAFIDDGKGEFWLPTNNSLFRVNIDSLANYMSNQSQNLYLYTFDNSDGLNSNEFNGAQPAYQWLSDSTLALPSMKGIATFNPYKLQIYSPDQKIFIDEFTVDSVNVHPNSLKEIIQLDPDFNLLTLKIGSPYYGNTQNLQLEYSIRKSSYEAQWQPLPGDGKLTINNLPSGDYEILFRKSGYTKNASNTYLNIRFEVLPHFYNTWGFYVSIIILIIVICYFIFRLRLNRLKKEKNRIEKIVNERTLELETTAQQLRLSEGALRQSNVQKEQIITMILHDLRSPLRFLKTITSGIMNNFQDEMSRSLSRSIDKLNGSALSLWEFTDRFFTWAITQQKDFEVEKTTFRLQEVFITISSFYKEILMLNGNILIVAQTDLICHTDQNILMLILRNLVDNANKNTMEGKVVLVASADADNIHITVRDEGKGLTGPEIMMFKNSSRASGRSGVGSLVIQNMIHKIDAALKIETSATGSAFTILLKKMQNHDLSLPIN